MKHYTWISLLAVLVGCGEPAPETTSTLSPLLSADPDRLWILARASKVGDGHECQELYLQPDDPRYKGLEQECDFWSRDYADYLRINGFPTVDHLHLHEREYWQWFVSRREQIATCKSLLKSPPVGTPRQQRDNIRALRDACDPYDYALQNENRSPADLGLRFN